MSETRDTQPPFDLSDIKEWLEGQPRDRTFDARSFRHCPVAEYLRERFETDQVAVDAFCWSVLPEDQIFRGDFLDHRTLAFTRSIESEGVVSVKDCLEAIANLKGDFALPDKKLSHRTATLV